MSALIPANARSAFSPDKVIRVLLQTDGLAVNTSRICSTWGTFLRRKLINNNLITVLSYPPLTEELLFSRYSAVNSNSQ